jgi:lysophospholipase L1-like esterase
MKPPTLSARHEGNLLMRSAFALLFMGAVITLIAGIALYRVQANTGTGNQLFRGFGVFFLLNLGGLGFLLLAPLARLHTVTEFLTRIFGQPRLAVVLGAFIFTATAAAIPVINNLLIERSEPVIFFTTGWGALLLVTLAICNAKALKDVLTPARPIWTIVGLGCVFSLLFLAIFSGSDIVVRGVIRNDRLHGIGSGYLDMTFYGNVVDEQQARMYWGEFAALQTSWVPYTYTANRPFQGQFIHVDEVGQRVTSSFMHDDVMAPEVAFFGGSTMWGYGSRDEYTLPSQIARLLNEAGKPIRATNFGQLGYVSTQDLIVFQRQLALGNTPDIAVFYHGSNDITTFEVNQQIAGLPFNEINRLRDLTAGTILRSGRPVLLQPNDQLADLDFSLTGIPDASPAQIVDLYLQNLRQIRAIASEYGVQILFVWQPAIMFKRNLVRQEQAGLNAINQQFPGFDTLYREVDEELRSRVQSENLEDILLLSDLFADDPNFRFIDMVHVTEDANFLIATQIISSLHPLLTITSGT